MSKNIRPDYSCKGLSSDEELAVEEGQACRLRRTFCHGHLPSSCFGSFRHESQGCWLALACQSNMFGTLGDLVSVFDNFSKSWHCYNLRLVSERQSSRVVL